MYPTPNTPGTSRFITIAVLLVALVGGLALMIVMNPQPDEIASAINTDEGPSATTTATPLPTPFVSDEPQTSESRGTVEVPPNPREDVPANVPAVRSMVEGTSSIAGLEVEARGGEISLGVPDSSVMIESVSRPLSLENLQTLVQDPCRDDAESSCYVTEIAGHDVVVIRPGEVYFQVYLALDDATTAILTAEGDPRRATGPDLTPEEALGVMADLLSEYSTRTN